MTFYVVRFEQEVGNTPAGTTSVIHETSSLLRRGTDEFPAVALLREEGFATRAEAEAFLAPEEAPVKRRARKSATSPADDTAARAAAELEAMREQGPDIDAADDDEQF